MKASRVLFATSLHGLLGISAALPQHPADAPYKNGESRPGKSLDGRADEISVAQAEQDFVAALSISGYDMSTFAGNVTDLATRLVRWDGCDKDERKMIYAGWQQSWKIMNLLYDEADKMNFNEASAVEYLGPPALNQNQQAAIKDMYPQVPLQIVSLPDTLHRQDTLTLALLHVFSKTWLRFSLATSRPPSTGDFTFAATIPGTSAPVAGKVIPTRTPPTRTRTAALLASTFARYTLELRI